MLKSIPCADNPIRNMSAFVFSLVVLLSFFALCLYKGTVHFDYLRRTAPGSYRGTHTYWHSFTLGGYSMVVQFFGMPYLPDRAEVEDAESAQLYGRLRKLVGMQYLAMGLILAPFAYVVLRD